MSIKHLHIKVAGIVKIFGFPLGTKTLTSGNVADYSGGVMQWRQECQKILLAENSSGHHLKSDQITVQPTNSHLGIIFQKIFACSFDAKSVRDLILFISYRVKLNDERIISVKTRQNRPIINH